MPTYTPMIQQYLQIKAEHPDTFLFFRLGDFYELFFDDAEFASRILEITLTGRDGGLEEKIPMCGVPYHSASSYIHKLVDKGYKVAICEQVEDPKLAKGVVKREVIRVITPGTVMDGKRIENIGNNYIASIAHIQIDGESEYGLSIGDVSTGEFYSTIITDSLENVVHELVSYQPSEVLISKQMVGSESFFEQYLDTTITWLNEDELKESNHHKFVYEQFQMEKDLPEVIIQSAGILIHYLQKTQHQKLIHFNELQVYEAKQYLLLDPFSRRNLEIAETSRDHSKKGSLLWLLDQTATSMGSRLLRRWLEKPLLSKILIEERLDAVQALHENPFAQEELSKQLKEIYDMERIVSKISFGNSTPRDLYALKRSLERVPKLLQLLDEYHIRPLQQKMDPIDICEDVYSFIHQSIADDPR